MECNNGVGLDFTHLSAIICDAIIYMLTVLASKYTCELAYLAPFKHFVDSTNFPLAMSLISAT